MKTKRRLFIPAVVSCFFLMLLAHEPSAKPRLLVLTDIGGDPDDQQSMVRLMLYCNEFEIEGLVATASGTPGELKEKVTKPHLIREIVEAYGVVRKNLALHADGYPPVDDLLNTIKSGNPNRGLDAIGEGLDTDGSNHIIAVVDSPDPRPVDIAVWGGQTDLAQALWRVRKDRGNDGLQAFIEKIRIYDINDQDGIVEWIWQQFPGLFYVLANAPDGADKREGAYRGMYLGGDESTTSLEWLDAHVRQNHGPLGALYPPKTWTAPNPHSALKEGDTPSWFYFLPHGLNDPQHPEWGGWGGRFTHSSDRIFRDATDTVGGVTEARAAVWRWRGAFQSGFQARMDWCVSGQYDQANHPPVAAIHGDTTQQIQLVSAQSGKSVQLNAAGSTDPDGNTLTFRWFDYCEAGSYGKSVMINNADSERCTVQLPPDAAGKTIHVILAVSDNGAPSLTRYRRVVITVE